MRIGVGRVAGFRGPDWDEVSQGLARRWRVGIRRSLLGGPGSPLFLLVFRAFRTGPARVVPRGVVAVGHGTLLLKTSAHANVGGSQVSTMPHASTGGGRARSAVTYHSRTSGEVDKKIVEHVREYESINNGAIQRLFDVDV